MLDAPKIDRAGSTRRRARATAAAAGPTVAHTTTSQMPELDRGGGPPHHADGRCAAEVDALGEVHRPAAVLGDGRGHEQRRLGDVARAHEAVDLAPTRCRRRRARRPRARPTARASAWACPVNFRSAGRSAIPTMHASPRSPTGAPPRFLGPTSGHRRFERRVLRSRRRAGQRFGGNEPAYSTARVTHVSSWRCRAHPGGVDVQPAVQRSARASRTARRAPASRTDRSGRGRRGRSGRPCRSRSPPSSRRPGSASPPNMRFSVMPALAGRRAPGCDRRGPRRTPRAERTPIRRPGHRRCTRRWCGRPRHPRRPSGVPDATSASRHASLLSVMKRSPAAERVHSSTRAGSTGTGREVEVQPDQPEVPTDPDRAGTELRPVVVDRRGVRELEARAVGASRR